MTYILQCMCTVLISKNGVSIFTKTLLVDVNSAPIYMLNIILMSVFHY